MDHILTGLEDIIGHFGHNRLRVNLNLKYLVYYNPYCFMVWSVLVCCLFSVLCSTNFRILTSITWGECSSVKQSHVMSRYYRHSTACNTCKHKFFSLPVMTIASQMGPNVCGCNQGSSQTYDANIHTNIPTLTFQATIAVQTQLYKYHRICSILKSCTHFMLVLIQLQLCVKSCYHECLHLRSHWYTCIPIYGRRPYNGFHTMECHIVHDIHDSVG